MAAIETIRFLQGLQRWQARIAFVVGRIASKLGLRGIERKLRNQVFGRYVAAYGTFDLRQGTLDAWVAHPAHERETHTRIRELVRGRGGILVDVGGYCGSFSLRNRDLFDRVYTFEPAPENFEALAQNVRLSAADDVITLVNAAACDKDGEGRLGLATPDTHSLATEERGDTIRVSTVRLDTYLDQQGVDLRSVRLLKADVEGAELAVLQGSQRVLALAGPLVLVEANTRAHEEALSNFLSSRGYILAHRMDGRNFLFIKEGQAERPGAARDVGASLRH